MSLSRRELLAGRGDAPRIGGRCLNAIGVYCDTCRDVCEPRAIAFTRGPARLAIPSIDPASCTRCGDCAAVCPAGAVEGSVEGVT